jgi:Rod binding domain-containing protein
MTDIPPISTTQSPRQSALWHAAQNLEQGFLSEMLKSAGLHASDAHGGDGHFRSFLIDEHAKTLVQNGGIGLAQHIFNSLVRMQNEQDH